MIHTARQSPKFIKFVRRLRPIVGSAIVDAESVAVAVLERLWHATATGAMRGDIGRFDNELIAESCGWMGDAEELIAILVECGWLDRCDQHRLLVHDWADHAPRHVKGNAAKKGGILGAAVKAQGQPIEPQGQLPMDGPPNQTNSNQLKPNQTKPESAAVEIALILKDAGVKARVKSFSEDLTDRGTTPADVRDAVLWMRHNRERLKEPPAALVAFLRDGSWPAEMDPPPTAEQIENRDRLQLLEHARKVRESVLWKTKGQPDENRKAAVREAVPGRLLEQIGGWCGNDVVLKREAAET